MASEPVATSVELPAALLEPACVCITTPSRLPADLGQAFDIKGPAGASLCARVRRAPGEAGSGRILQKGEPPANGWTFAAPSAIGGVVAFSGVVRAARPPSTRPDIEGNEGRSAEAEAEDMPKGDDDLGATRIDDGEWHHVAVVISADCIRAYVDGKPDGEAAVKVAAVPGASLILAPQAEEGGGDGVRSDGLRDVKVFSEALSDSQIADIASGRKDLPSGITLPFLPVDVSEIWGLQGGGKALPSTQGDSTVYRDITGSDGVAADTVVGAQDGALRVRELLMGHLGLGQDPSRSFQDEVICDFFVDLLVYARSICMTTRKAAVALAIVAAVFDVMRSRSKTATRVGEPATLSECFLECKRHLLANTATAGGTSGDPGSASRLQIFFPSDIRLLTEFLTGNLFEHFVLYQCVLVCPQVSSTEHVEVILERPQHPPDLRRAKLCVAADAAPRANGGVATTSGGGSTTANAPPFQRPSGLAGGAEGNRPSVGVSVEQASASEPLEAPLSNAMPNSGHPEEDARDDLTHFCSDAGVAAESTADALIEARDKALASARPK